MSHPVAKRHAGGAPVVAPVRTSEDEKVPISWPTPIDPSPSPAGGVTTPSSVRARATPGQSPQANTSSARMQSPGFLPGTSTPSGRSPPAKRTPASPSTQVYSGRQSSAQKKEAVFRALASGGVSGSRRAVASPNVLATPGSIPGSPLFLPGIGLTNQPTVEERIAQDIAQAQGQSRRGPNGVLPLQGLRTPGSQHGGSVYGGSQHSSHLPSQVASALHSHRSTNSQQAYAAKKLAMEQEHAAQMEALRLKQEKEQSSRYAEEQAALLATHQKAMAEAEAIRQAEEDEHKFLNSYENFPPAAVYDTPFSQEEEQALLTFLQHSDNTLLSESMKRTLTSSQLKSMYERPNEDGGGHYSLELLLVHLQHLNLTGVEHPSLQALGEAIEHAENHSTAHGAGAPPPLLAGQTKGPAHHAGAYAIRRKIWLYLKRKEVTIYPGITWAEVEQLFILTLAGPRLGSILYRLDQIGIHFPTFHSLLTHVSEIYARKASQHTNNCQTLLQFLYDHQEVVYWEPRTDAEEVRPKVKSLPLFLEPLQPSLGLTKRLMELGLGVTTMVYLTECFLQSRYQFDTEAKYVEELQKAFGFLRACVRKAHSFLQSEPSIAVWSKRSKDVSAAASGACILALGPSPAPASKKRSSSAIPSPLPGRHTSSFLTKVTLADVERLIKESGLLNYTPASEAGVAGGETNDTGDDQVLNVLVSLNTQVDLQIKPPYTTFDQIIADVRADRSTRWDAASGHVGSPSGGANGAGMLFSPGSFPLDDSAEDLADALKSDEAEKRRALRAKKKGRMVAQILSSLREYLLSAEATVLRRKKEGLLITDEELQSLLANGGGSLESVKGHCRQLVDQGIYAATIAELQESVSYSHQLSLEQQKEHRRILYDALRSAGLLDPAAFPFTAGPTPEDRPFQRHYQSDVSPRVDDALNALLFFNAQGQHPTPKPQVYLTNYFYNPFATLSTLIFLISIAEEQNSGSTTLKTALEKFHQARLSRSQEDDEEEEEDEEESEERKEARMELQVRNLSLLLHTFHGLYTAYLHAKKQVHDYLRSEKCELKVMGSAAPESNEIVNLLPTCTITDVESLFASSSVGLKILPYLMEISYTPESFQTSKESKKVFQGWKEVQLALARMHARKQHSKADRESSRRALREYLESAENRILRTDMSAISTDNQSAGAGLDGREDVNEKLKQPFVWTEYDLDQLLEAGGGQIAQTLTHLKKLNGDSYTVARLTSLTILVESIRQLHRMATKHIAALHAYLTSRAGYALLTCQGVYDPAAKTSAKSKAITLLDAQRIYTESGAVERTLSYIKRLTSGTTFPTVDALLSAIKSSHTEQQKQANREQMVLMSFFATHTDALFTQATHFTDEDLAAIHAEKMDAPFSLLLLSLSALTATDHTFDSPSEFRDELHAKHVSLLNDYQKSLEYLTRADIAARLFDLSKGSSKPAAAGTADENQQPPFTAKQVLSLFETLEAQVSVYTSLNRWEKQGHKFASWSDMVKELLVQKDHADVEQQTVEAALEQRHQVKILIAYYELLTDETIKLIDPADIDGLLALDLTPPQNDASAALAAAAGGKHDPINTLHAYFASYKAQSLTFKSFAQLVKVVQVETEVKPACFLDSPHVPTQQTKAKRQDEEEEEKEAGPSAAVAAYEEEARAAAITAASSGRKYVLSAPIAVDHEHDSDAAALATDAAGKEKLPSQQQTSKYILFTPSTSASTVAPAEAPVASGKARPTSAKLKLNLVQTLQTLAKRQPWLEGSEDGGEVVDPDEQSNRRYSLFVALSWPQCHLFSRRTIPLPLNDDDLDELLLACGGGASGVTHALDLVRTLDGEGYKFFDMESLVLEVGERYQRQEIGEYMSTYGGLLSELVGTPSVMSAGFIEKLLTHTGVNPLSNTTPAEFDPLLPIAHALARTQAFFEGEFAQAREGKLKKALHEGDSLAGVDTKRTITLEHFLQTFRHFNISARRGILHDLLSEGLPPFFESLFMSHLTPTHLQGQLTDRRLDALLALHSHSLYRTVRTLKDLEFEAHRFASVQELTEGYMACAAARRAQLGKEAAAAGFKLDAARSEKARRLAEIEAQNALAMEVQAEQDQDDPALFHRRQSVFNGLSAPQCLLFDQRRDHIALTDKDLDEIVQVGGGLASTLHYISLLDEADTKFYTFERAVIGLSQKRQFDMTSEFWSQVQANAKACYKDPAKQQSCAEKGIPYRYFTQETADMKKALTQELFDYMIQEGMGGVDPSCTLVAVLESLSRRDGNTVVPTPLFLNRADLVAAIRRETQLMKRHALSLYLFDPTRKLLNFPTPPAIAQMNSALSNTKSGSASGKLAVALKSRFTASTTVSKFCRWEGLSSSEADELLSMCENSLFLTLRHCHMLEKSGFFFQASIELLEALVLTQQHLLEEESDQSSLPTAASVSLRAAQKADAVTTEQMLQQQVKKEEEAEQRRQQEHEERVLAGEHHLHAATLAMAAETKLHYQSQLGAGVDYLPPWNPDEVSHEMSMSDTTRALEDAWREHYDIPSHQQAFLDALHSSTIFSEASPFPTFTPAELDSTLAYVKGRREDFQACLLELERQHQRYTDPFTFLQDLRLLTSHQLSESLLHALAFPGCTIFSDVPEPVEVDEKHLRALIAAAGHSLGNAKRIIRALDQQGLKLDSLEELIATVKNLRDERRKLKNMKEHERPLLPPGAVVDLSTPEPVIPAAKTTIGAAPKPKPAAAAPSAGQPAAFAAAPAAVRTTPSPTAVTIDPTPHDQPRRPSSEAAPTPPKGILKKNSLLRTVTFDPSKPLVPVSTEAESEAERKARKAAKKARKSAETLADEERASTDPIAQLERAQSALYHDPSQATKAPKPGRDNETPEERKARKLAKKQKKEKKELQRTSTINTAAPPSEATILAQPVATSTSAPPAA